MSSPLLVSHLSSQGIGNIIYSLIFNRGIAKKFSLADSGIIYIDITGAIGPMQGDELDLSYFQYIFEYLGIEYRLNSDSSFQIYSSKLLDMSVNRLHPRVKNIFERYLPQSYLFHSNLIVEIKPFSHPDEAKIESLTSDKTILLKGNFINNRIHETLQYGFTQFSKNCLFTEARKNIIDSLAERSILFAENTIHTHIRGGDYLTPKNKLLYLPPSALYYRDAFYNLVNKYELSCARIYIHSNDIIYAESLISQLISSFGPSFEFIYLDLHPLESFECFRQASLVVGTN